MRIFENKRIVKNVCCIGAGYVGGPTMAVIADRCPSIKVTVVDINAARIKAWNESDLTKLPVYEPGLDLVIKRTRGRNLFFSVEVENANSEAVTVINSENIFDINEQIIQNHLVTINQIKSKTLSKNL